MPADSPHTAPPCDVLVCNSPFAHLDLVLDQLCDALSGGPHAVVRLPSARALAHEPALLARARVIAGYGNMPITAQLLDAAPRLCGIASCVSGTDGIDLHAASERGVLVAHGPTPQNFRGMAEAAVLLLLHLMYDLDGTREDLRARRPRPEPLRARLLQGKRVGLLGWGRIAQTLATLLSTWEVELLVHSRRGQVEVPPHARCVDLPTLLYESDAVCVLAGAEAGAPPLVGRAELARMPPHAYLINLSRGSTVDEAALTEALRAGALGGAALDVFATEPLPADSPLRTLPNVVLTPHHVGHTREGDASLGPALVANVAALLDGRVPPLVRNPQATPRWLQSFGARPTPQMETTP